MVDDHEDFARSLLRLLEPKFPEAEFCHASSDEEARRVVFARFPDVVLLDLEIDPLFGVESGLHLLSWIRSHAPHAEILVLTANDCAENGMRALERGARSFLSKPPRIEQLAALLEDALRLREIKQHLASKQTELPKEIPGLVGSSAAFQKLSTDIQLAASCDLNLLILGESGVGKSQVAETIHRFSTRANKPFLRAHAIFGNSELAQSELFGHKKGAFTGAHDDRKGLFERAGAGSIFLDECAEFPLNIQVLLLDVLQSGRFLPLGGTQEKTSTARVMAATNASLGERLDAGQFRYDLFYRLSSLVIHVPSLQERKEDIPLLAQHFLSYKEQGAFAHFSISPELVNSWLKLPWKGNVRELEQRVLAAAFRAKLRGAQYLELQDDVPLLTPGGKEVASSSFYSSSFHEQVHAFKVKLVQQALRDAGGNQSQAALALGLDRSSFRRILAEGGLVGAHQDTER